MSRAASRRTAHVVDGCVVALLASSAVLIERLRGLDHAAGDLVQMFIPGFAWWWSEPRWLGGWNPWVFGGFPANADPLVGHVHPLGLVWALFPPLDAAAIEGALAPALAGIGMLVYLRAAGCGRLGSLVAAASFAAAGYVHAHAVHPEKLRSVLALPWALAAVERLAGLGLVAGLGTAVAVLVAGGHPQTIVYSLGLVVAYALWLGRPRGRRALALAAAVGLGVLVPAITWLPAIQLILRSSHSGTMLTGGNHLTGACLSTLVVPFACGGGTGALYGQAQAAFPGCGLIDCTGYPGMVVLLALLAGWRRVLATPRGRFWAAVAVAGVVLATGVAEQWTAVPGVRSPARALLWWNFGIAAAAGFALGPRRANDGPHLPSRGAWLLAAAALALVIVAATTTGPVARRASAGTSLVLLASTAAALVAAGRGARWGRGLLVALLAADLVAFGAAMHAGIPRADEGIRRQLGALRRAVAQVGEDPALGRVLVAPLLVGASWASLEQVPLLQGWNVLVPRAYSRLLGTDAPSTYEFALMLEPRRLAPGDTTLDVLRVEVLAVAERLAAQPAWQRALAHPRWRRIGGTDGWQLWANRRARPVAWLVHRTRTASQREALALLHGEVGAFDPAVEATTKRPIPRLDAAPAAPGRADVVAWDDDELTLRVDVAATALLVTSEVAYPGWRATLNGRRTPIRIVNGGLRAVVVPPGTHTVVFAYRPLAARIGLWIGLASAALLAVAGVAARRRPRRAASAANGLDSPPATERHAS